MKLNLGETAGAVTRYSGANRWSLPSGSIVDGKIVRFKGKFVWRGTIEIQTLYARGVKPDAFSCYGRGTTLGDVRAGNVTLAFHESCHRNDFIAFLKSRPLPEPPNLAVGMTQHHCQYFKGLGPRQARSQRPPRENRRGGNLAVFEHRKRSAVVAAAGIGGGRGRLRYRRWTQHQLHKALEDFTKAFNAYFEAMEQDSFRRTDEAGHAKSTWLRTGVCHGHRAPGP